MPGAQLQVVLVMLHTICCYLKSMLLHSVDDVFKEYFGGQGVAMVDYRLHIWPIPAVNLQTATAFPQSTVPHTHTQMQTYTETHTYTH